MAVGSLIYKAVEPTLDLRQVIISQVPNWQRGSEIVLLRQDQIQCRGIKKYLWSLYS